MSRSGFVVHPAPCPNITDSFLPRDEEAQSETLTTKLCLVLKLNITCTSVLSINIHGVELCFGDLEEFQNKLFGDNVTKCMIHITKSLILLLFFRRNIHEEQDDLETPQERRARWISIRIIYFTMFLMSLGFSIILTGVWPYLDKVSNISAVSRERFLKQSSKAAVDQFNGSVCLEINVVQINLLQ
jgi:hypothetical protein